MTPEERGAIASVAAYDQAMAEVRDLFPGRDREWYHAYILRVGAYMGLWDDDATTA